MANVAIINYCNLKCPYCFADDMIHEKAKHMPLNDYIKILDFLARTPKNHVGIIGGEPTLHPHFSDILAETNRYCREVGTDATLFTNGIHLEKYMPEIGERIHILLNINSMDYQGFENWNKLMETMDHMADLCWFDQKVGCGCNIHPGQTDYTFIWELVEKYHLNHLRTSVVSPSACYEEYRKDKHAYFEMMKPIFLEHAQHAIEHNCRLGMDCGHIPKCYFSVEEQQMLESICDGLWNDFCEPVVDITPEFKATACFGSYDPVDIRDFDNLIELERYLMMKKSLPRVYANCQGKCSTCKKHDNLQCAGGCLGFADV